jgi:hypothetical protein
MAFAALSNTWTAWYLANRPGSAPAGTPGTALISDLIANDYLVGGRMTVVSTGTTTSGVRTLTVKRADGPNFTVAYTAASSVLIIRP